jgi:glycine cleavage system H protein
MPIVNGCVLPDDLLYDVERQVWYRELGEGLVEVGVTSVAVAMAGTIVAVTPKRASRRLAAGNACAVFESGKFVGPTKVAFFAEIVRSNEGLMEQPSSAHADPYGAAWLVVLSPDDWNPAKQHLTPRLRRRRALSRADAGSQFRRLWGLGSGAPTPRREISSAGLPFRRARPDAPRRGGESNRSPHARTLRGANRDAR